MSREQRTHVRTQHALQQSPGKGPSKRRVSDPLSPQQVRDGVHDVVGLVRELVDLVPAGHTRQDETRLHTRLGSRHDVRVHAIADDDGVWYDTSSMIGYR